jgi:hypothetical protein
LRIDRRDLAGSRVFIGDEGEPHALVNRARQIVDNHAARPLDQPPLGFRRRAIAEHQHRLSGDLVEQRQAGDPAHFAVTAAIPARARHP